jgi:hypothetical protein
MSTKNTKIEFLDGLTEVVGNVFDVYRMRKIKQDFIKVKVNYFRSLTINQLSNLVHNLKTSNTIRDEYLADYFSRVKVVFGEFKSGSIEYSNRSSQKILESMIWNIELILIEKRSLKQR